MSATIPPELRELAGKASFWGHYFWQVERWFQSALDPAPQAFPEESDSQTAQARWPGSLMRVSLGGYGLHLESSPEYESLHLWLLAPGEEPVQAAWDTRADWSPSVLAWDELDLICRLVALEDPALAHPGLPLLLMARFGVIADDATASQAFPQLSAAWRRIGFSELASRTRQFDLRGNGIEWHAWAAWPELGSRAFLAQSDEAAEAAPLALQSTRTGPLLAQPDTMSPQTWLARDGSPEESLFPFAAWDGLLRAARSRYREHRREEWLTSASGSRTVPALAAEIVATADFCTAPVVADALEDSGCRHEGLLKALRSNEPSEVCWAVEFLADAEIGSLARRVLAEPQPRKQATLVEIWFPAEQPRTSQTGPCEHAGIQRAARVHAALMQAGRGRAISLPGEQDDYVLVATLSGDIGSAWEVARQALGELPAQARGSILLPKRQPIDLRGPYRG